MGIIFLGISFLKLAATSEIFEILSCNDENKESFKKITRILSNSWIWNFRKFPKIPQLTYQIAESYFDNNEFLSESKDDYQKKNGFYERSVNNSDLTIQFTDKDCKWNHFLLILRKSMHVKT